MHREGYESDGEGMERIEGGIQTNRGGHAKDRKRKHVKKQEEGNKIERRKLLGVSHCKGGRGHVCEDAGMWGYKTGRLL
jgi:hypothetical protein